MATRTIKTELTRAAAECIIGRTIGRLWAAEISAEIHYSGPENFLTETSRAARVVITAAESDLDTIERTLRIAAAHFVHATAAVFINAISIGPEGNAK